MTLPETLARFRVHVQAEREATEAVDKAEQARRVSRQNKVQEALRVAELAERDPRAVYCTDKLLTLETRVFGRNTGRGRWRPRSEAPPSSDEYRPRLDMNCSAEESEFWFVLPDEVHPGYSEWDCRPICDALLGTEWAQRSAPVFQGDSE